MAGDSKIMEKVRKLLAQAEDESVTPHEAEAFTERATELMARYGIEQAMLGALHPETGKPADRKIDVDNPWADVRAYLLGGLARAMRCSAVQLSGQRSGTRIHLFGFQSDLERVDVLYTSLLLQMASALQRAGAPVPGGRPPHLEGARQRAWNRSFLLGYAGEVIRRVQTAEEHAVEKSTAGDAGRSGPGTALVLASREAQVKSALSAEYPNTRPSRITYSGGGAACGRAEGGKANIGGTGVGGGSRKALA